MITIYSSKPVAGNIMTSFASSITVNDFLIWTEDGRRESRTFRSPNTSLRFRHSAMNEWSLAGEQTLCFLILSTVWALECLLEANEPDSFVFANRPDMVGLQERLQAFT